MTLQPHVVTCPPSHTPLEEEGLRVVGSALWTVFFMLFKLNLSLPDFSLALISFWNRTCETGRENVTLGLWSVHLCRGGGAERWGHDV